MTQSTMKAMAYASYGGVEKLEQVELPVPKVSPGMVRIKIKAAGVNPVDWAVMGGYLDQVLTVHFPVVPGWDVSGVVEAVGFDTPEFQVGDEVHAYGRRDSVGIGTFAQYVTLPADVVADKPKELSFEEAAALPLTGGTALRTIDALRLAPGRVLLIHNGSGGVGQAGIQIAKAAGVRVLATSSPKNHAHLASLGAEPLTYGEGLVDEVRDLVPQGVDAVADFHGGTLEQTLAVLKDSGRHASIADGSAGEHRGDYIWVRPIGVELERLNDLVRAGKLGVHVVASFPSWRVCRSMETLMHAAVLGRFGQALSDLTRADFDALSVLERAGRPMMPTEMAQELLTSPAGITKRIKKLVEDGIVSRRVNPTDARGALIDIAGPAKRSALPILESVWEFESELLAVFSEPEREAVTAGLRTLLMELEPPI